MKIIIYTGTSISHEDARKILHATYLPPVKRDDITNIIASSPDIIGIIDGIFFDRASVAHREIIQALNKGITVVGGASMGALRAYELEPYGMIGVGKIYNMYKSGYIESDDEVAVTFDPETLKPLSTPLVNIRMTLKKALEMRILDDEQACAFLNIARKMFYPERNFRSIVSECIKRGIIKRNEKAKLLDFFMNNEVDVKHEDAILVLKKIKEIKKEMS